ncbi:DUF1800 domain-containing protein [Vibrio sp. T187]|uniref:DUF1800 domain-containing protein n=1 Tax=Vibrio TaxID=662 RepID=UPI0010C95FEC|nr:MULTISPECIES: DUF1800 domain-containing protein [Vibrio]MBW3697763.1 DUF1800 domain-containing protein [Vibrio sp. T187]
MDESKIERIVESQRYGFGTVNGQQSMPLQQQLKSNAYTHRAILELPSTSEQLLTMDKNHQERKKAAKQPDKKKQIQKQIREFSQQSYRQSVQARHLQTSTTSVDFQERLIQFWSNHFAVSADTQKIRPIVSGIENEVIRSSWSGNFSDMLVKVCKHPTMLMFLDNHISVGPNSKRGNKSKRGLNENLAREIMELHTLGVSSSYTQQDVIQLAKALTGWSVRFREPIPGFTFNPNTHEPGTFTVFGRQYHAADKPQQSYRQAEQCLRDLALHKDTAQHLSTKLTQHFWGETPQEVIDDLADVYLQFKGELMPVYQALINHPYGQVITPLRYRTPQEWYFALVRSVELPIPEKRSLNFLRILGQQPFMAGSPAGWPDRDQDYNSPSGLTQRWNVADQMTHLVVKHLKEQNADINQWFNGAVDNLYGSDLDEHTQVLLAKTKNIKTKLLLIWLSPQFQYR